MPLDIRNPFLFGAGLSLLNTAGQYGADPFGSALRQGYEFDLFDQERRRAEEDRARKEEEIRLARERQRRLDEMNEQKFMWQKAQMEAAIAEAEEQRLRQEQDREAIGRFTSVLSPPVGGVGPMPSSQSVRSLGAEAASAGMPGNILSMFLPPSADELEEQEYQRNLKRQDFGLRQGNLAVSQGHLTLAQKAATRPKAPSGIPLEHRVQQERNDYVRDFVNQKRDLYFGEASLAQEMAWAQEANTVFDATQRLGGSGVATAESLTPSQEDHLRRRAKEGGATEAEAEEVVARARRDGFEAVWRWLSKKR